MGVVDYPSCGAVLGEDLVQRDLLDLIRVGLPQDIPPFH
jgi:hypothetical protein